MSESKKKNLFQKAVDAVFVDPEHTPDLREWDSLTPEEQDAIRMEARAKFVKGEPHRKLSPFTQAGKAVSEAIGSVRIPVGRPKLAPPPQSERWDDFMNQREAEQAAKPKLFDRVASFPTSAPPPSPDTVDAQILMDLSKARREGNETKQQTLREVWEARKKKDSPAR
jgi:hypothetical protein